MGLKDKGYYPYWIDNELLKEVGEASDWMGVKKISFIRGSLRLAIRNAQKEGFNFEETITVSKGQDSHDNCTEFQMYEEKEFIAMGHKLAVSHFDQKGKNMTLRKFLTEQIKLNIKRLKKLGFGE